ncbi:MAG: hypothetical protein ACI8UO_001166 [Verrucomicrobiales bacterium]|jgi:hypothetical protein
MIPRAMLFFVPTLAFSNMVNEPRFPLCSVYREDARGLVVRWLAPPRFVCMSGITEFLKFSNVMATKKQAKSVHSQEPGFVSSQVMHPRKHSEGLLTIYDRNACETFPSLSLCWILRHSPSGKWRQFSSRVKAQKGMAQIARSGSLDSLFDPASDESGNNRREIRPEPGKAPSSAPSDSETKSLNQQLANSFGNLDPEKIVNRLENEIQTGDGSTALKAIEIALKWGVGTPSTRRK